jgi:hypothetical protein
LCKNIEEKDMTPLVLLIVIVDLIFIVASVYKITTKYSNNKTTEINRIVSIKNTQHQQQNDASMYLSINVKLKEKKNKIIFKIKTLLNNINTYIKNQHKNINTNYSVKINDVHCQTEWKLSLISNEQRKMLTPEIKRDIDYIEKLLLRLIHENLIPTKSEFVKLNNLYKQYKDLNSTQ